MMKKILSTACVALVIGAHQEAFSASGELFAITGTGLTATIDIKLCLNGKAALSCQKFTVTRETLSIRTTLPNHNYPFVGIKVTTPGYTLTGCTPTSNGYCIFSTNDTTPQTITAVGTVSGLAIGDSYGGGTVACLGGGQLNLIAATTDNSSSIDWGNTSTDIPNAQSTLNGAANTDAIVNSSGTFTYAATICKNYQGGGFLDWFLPAIDQLSCLYTNRDAIGEFQNGFNISNYWSSTQVNTSNANAIDFNSDTYQSVAKSKPYNVRCVRMF